MSLGRNPLGEALEPLLTEWIHVAQLLVLGPLGALLAGALGRGLVAVRQAQGGVGSLHGAGVDVRGAAVDGGGAGLPGPHRADGVLQAGARGAQHGCRGEREGGR